MCTGSRFFAVSVIGLFSGQLAISQNVIHVDPAAPDSPNNGINWRQAYHTLQEALEDPNLAFGDQIWVAQGTYKPTFQFRVDGGPTSTQNATFLIPTGVSVFGGFRGNVDPNDPNDFGETFLIQRDETTNLTILSGELGDPEDFTDNAFHVVTALNVAASTKLSGFVIERGNANADPNSALPIEFDRIGGGILIAGTETMAGHQQSSLRVTRCVIRNNVSHLRGGGVATIWSKVPGNPNNVLPARLVNNLILNNTASFTNEDPNDADGIGGGVAVISAAIESTNCVFFSNASGSQERFPGGGASLEDGSDPNTLSVGEFSHCSFSANKALNGAAIHAPTALDVLVRNSICWNDGYLMLSDPDAELRGSIDASFSDIQFDGTAFVSISDPNSNINVDPQFCADPNMAPPLPYDFLLMLGESSPCVDAGLDAYVPDDNADVDDDGNAAETIQWDQGKRTRQFDSVSGGERVDMGAYELRIPTSCAEDLNDDGDIDVVDLAILLAVLGSNPGTCPVHPADIDRDGDIQLDDLADLLAVFGCPCGSSCLTTGGFEGEPEEVWTEQTSNIPTPGFVEWARQASIEELQNWRAWYTGGGSQEY